LPSYEVDIQNCQVSPRENIPYPGDNSGCPPHKKAIIVLLYQTDTPKKHTKNANTLPSREIKARDLFLSNSSKLFCALLILTYVENESEYV